MSTNPLDDIGAALNRAFAETAALTARLEEAEARVTTNCLYGPTVPINGFAELADFVAKTFKPEVVRCYPGSTNSLSQVRTAISTYPGAAIVYNMHVASKALTQAQVDTLVKALEVEAAKCPRFVLCPDAEPDRKDRTYTTQQFMAAFQLVAHSVEAYAPHVEVSVNLTGYDFTNRIGAYDYLLPMYDVLSLDPYWVGAPDSVQGSEKDLNAAVTWCDQNGKRLALSEWGAQLGDYRLLSNALMWIRQHDIEWSCYFQEARGSANIGSTKITTPEAYAVYRAGAS